MANTPSAKKRASQAEQRRRRNASRRSMMRTYLKATIAAIESADKSAAEAAYKIVVPILDSAACRGIITKNKAARHKSRMNTQIRAL